MMLKIGVMGVSDRVKQMNNRKIDIENRCKETDTYYTRRRFYYT